MSNDDFVRRSLTDLIKENKFTRLPLGGKFACKFDSFKETASGNGSRT